MFRALVDGTLTVSYDYQSYDLTLNAPAGWEFTSEIPAQIKTGMDGFTVTMQQQTAAAQAAGKKIESDKAEVEVSGVTTKGVAKSGEPYVVSDADGADGSGKFSDRGKFLIAIADGTLYVENAGKYEVAEASDWTADTVFYKENGSYVAPVVATAEVEVTIGNVTGDVTANLSIET